MNAQQIMERAERYCFVEDAAYIRREIDNAQMRIVTANATPARKQAERAYKRTLRTLALVEREYEDDKYQAESAAALREYDEEQQRHAWSRGADYQTEMRMRDRIHYWYGKGAS